MRPGSDAFSWQIQRGSTLPRSCPTYAPNPTTGGPARRAAVANLSRQTSGAHSRDPVGQTVPPDTNLLHKNVLFWHETDLPSWSLQVRFRGQSGKHRLLASISE